MNEAHWHLVVNHIPIIFPIVGVIVIITGFVSKSEAVKRTAYLIFTIGALSTLAAMNTGEGAEEIVEEISGISHDYIEEHEESAEIFAWLSYLLGALSLLGLWASFKKKSFSNILSVVVLLYAMVVIYFGRQAGTTGGEIRHTEIRSDYSAPVSEHEQEEEHDND